MEVLTVIAAALALTGREAAKTVVSEGVKIGDHRERQYSDLGVFSFTFATVRAHDRALHRDSRATERSCRLVLLSPEQVACLTDWSAISTPAARRQS